MSDAIDLTPAEVLRLSSVRGEYQRLLSLYAGPLGEVDAAFHALSSTLAEVLKTHGQEANGETWDIKEDGDAVRLVKRVADG